jgi:hypothetical protein
MTIATTVIELPITLPAMIAEPEMPPALEQALHEFELMAAFRARPPTEQRDYIDWITGTVCVTGQRNSIAVVLDQLAGASATFSPKRTN